MNLFYIYNSFISYLIMATTSNTHNRKSYYWITLFSLFILSIFSGVFGFYTYFSWHDEPFNWLRIAYCTLQLFAFEGGDLTGPIPWALEIARFTAGLTTALTIISALFGIFRDQLNRMWISRMKNHVVIIGLGTKGKNVMQERLRKNERVLIIDIDPLNPNLSAARSAKCRFLSGDATNINILKKARITKAKSVFLLMGDDTQQVDCCLHIYKLIRESSRNENDALSCIMHLQQQEFLNTMRNHKLVEDTRDGLILNIFSAYENSARVLFEETPPDRSGISKESKNYVQMIIFGFGKAGEALALQTAYTGHYLNGEKPKVLIIDRMAKVKIPDFQERYPSYTDYCDLEYLALEAKSPQLVQQLINKLEGPDAYKTIVLCFDNKTHNTLLGLQLENIDLEETDQFPRVFVRTDDNTSFSSFSENIKPYGLPSKVCSQEVIIEGDLDRKGRGIHKRFLEKRKEGPDFGKNEADVSWENLSQEYKDSNRKAADHIGVKMRSIACEIVDVNDPRPAVTDFEDFMEELSALEHRRWNAVRSLSGWTYGDQKNDKTRKTPYLVDWDKLEDDIKEYDRISVRNIPNVLNLIGLKVVKKEEA